jgi:hypothetical protein
MSDYALLIAPSVNRVYADAAADLVTAELEVLSDAALDGRITRIDRAVIGGVGYVTFIADKLAERDLAFLGRTSAAFALFERLDDLLRPLELTSGDQFDDDLVTILKYPGKTNEQFTRLLLNVTLLSSTHAAGMIDERLRVIDPLCGRGTTLNEALTHGYDAAGIDIDTKDFEAYAAFVQTYLKRKKIKHQAESGPIRRERKVVGRRLQVTLAATKESYRAGDTLRLDVVNADTTRVLEFFKAGSFDAVVTDLPYGVQHGSRTAEGLRRGPLDLLTAAVPGWAALLRPGGAMGIAWNTHVARRDDAAAVLAGAGLTVLDDGPYRRFAHWVDQSITRDILVARKP